MYSYIMKILHHILFILVAMLAISCSATPQKDSDTATEVTPSKITIYWDNLLRVCPPTSEEYIMNVKSQKSYLLQASYNYQDGAIFNDFVELLSNAIAAPKVIIPSDCFFPESVEIIDNNGESIISSSMRECVNCDIYADCLILYEYDCERNADTICFRNSSQRGIARLNSNFVLTNTSVFNSARNRIYEARCAQLHIE